MYNPKHFAQTDIPLLHQFMQANNFGIIVSHDEETGLSATHMPVMLHPERGEQGTLLTHMARANPQWKSFSSGREVMVIFPGPHTYISPSWYEQPASVPTWNYAVVHAYGTPRLIEDHQELYSLLGELVSHQEANFEHPWALDAQRAHAEKIMPGTIGMEITITRLEGKYKMSQNRPMGDRHRVIEELSKSDYPPDQQVADLMQSLYPKD